MIPNSHVVLIPPSPEAGNETLSVRANEDWHKSLFLHPGDWIKWVVTVLVVVVILLAGVIYLLHMNEKVSSLEFPEGTDYIVLTLRAFSLFDLCCSERTSWKEEKLCIESTFRLCSLSRDSSSLLQSRSI